MNKNWYIIYSKPHFEKKIVAICNKKKIESYFPLGLVGKATSRKGKESFEPLFTSMVFIKSTPEGIKEVTKIEGVIGLMFWLDKFAIIREKEIEAIKEFTKMYEDITVEKSEVNLAEEISNVSLPVKSVDSKVYSMNSKEIKVNLPSLGYILSAEILTNHVFGVREFNFKSDILKRQILE